MQNAQSLDALSVAGTPSEPRPCKKGCIAARKYTDRIGVYERNLPTSKAFGMSPLKTGRTLTSPRQAQIEKTVSATTLSELAW